MHFHLSPPCFYYLSGHIHKAFISYQINDKNDGKNRNLKYMLHYMELVLEE